MTKANRKEIYLAADTEAQTAWNDEELSDYVNVELKGQRAAILQRLKNYDDEVAARKLRQLNQRIDDLSLQLCNQMNTYLLGYCEINPALKQVKNQDLWVKRHVNYWLDTNSNSTPWTYFLDEIYRKYGQKIKRGNDYKLIIYFHNLDYDAQNFLQGAMDNAFNYQVHDLSCLHNGTLYSVSFIYRDCVIELRDSMKIYNQALAELGKNVGWSKKTDKATYQWFDLVRDRDKLDDEIYYFKYDIAVLAAVMRQHFQKLPGKSRLTAAGYAEADLKKQVKKDDRKRGTDYYHSLFEPAFTKQQEHYLRSAYFGGFVYANRKLLNRPLKNGLVGDVNSLYPSVMLNRDYPDYMSLRTMSAAEFKALDLHDLHTFSIFTIQVDALKIKDNGVPCIPKKEAFGLASEIYNLDDLAKPALTITNFDLYWIKKNYDIEYHYVTGVIAQSFMVRPFKNFVLKHKKEKEDAVARGNKVDKMIAKIHLNSTYGKFAQRVIDTKTELIRKDDGSIGFSEVLDQNADEKQHNILIAVFVTAFARDVLLEMIEIIKHEKLAQFWYCDTDAVHFGYKGKLDIVKDDETIFKELKIPFSKNIFGKWKPEQHMTRAIYLGSKRYWEDDPLLGATIKGSGIQKRGKAFLIQQGFKAFCYMKERPLIVPFAVSKKVVGGVKIFDSIKLIDPTPVQYKLIGWE